MAGWQKLPFDEAVADESGGNIKTPQSEFLDEGEFAVVDQGKELVSGWVNDGTRLCRSPLPVVVFGDHTRCIKYVDFPFCMGADGIKVLRPKVDADVKYLFHFLRQLRLHDGGYDRHFKYLKRAEVVLPPLAEQRRIAEVLDRAEALRAKRRAALAQLDSLTQSLFLDLFGDPRKNEKGWPLVPIGSVVSDIMRGAALEPEDFVETGFPVLHKGAIKPNGVISIDTRKKTFAPVEFANANPNSRATRAHTAVNLRDLVPTGPSIGLAADLRDGPFDEYILAQGAYAFRLAAEKMMPEYFVYLSNMPNFRHVLRQNAVGSTQIHIRTPIYFAIQIPCPPIEMQRKFARQVRAVDKLMAAQRAALAELDALFASLQNRAFKGEL